MNVNIYIGLSSKSPRKAERKICYILGCQIHRREEFRGGDPETVTETCHGATIIAISRALKRITGPCMVTIYAEDAWVLNMISKKQMEEWEKTGFRNKKGAPIQMQKEWMQIWLISKQHEIQTVAGRHSFSRWMEEQMKGEKNV